VLVVTDDRAASTRMAALAVALLAAPLAGCISAGPSFDSYEEAREAPGTLVTLENADHDIQLKTLVPVDPHEDVPTGENNLYVLLYDGEADEPLTDARIGIEVTKTHEDRSSSHVQAPTHSGNGIFHAVATFDEAGGWIAEFDVETGDGRDLTFPVHFSVGDVDEDADPAADEDTQES
jgi:hypothetical protein